MCVVQAEQSKEPAKILWRRAFELHLAARGGVLEAEADRVQPLPGIVPLLDALADRVRQGIGGEPFHLGDREVTVTASVGTSHMNTWPVDLPTLLTEADEAMYRAKAHRPAR